jgi:hypothetical protein
MTMSSMCVSLLFVNALNAPTKPAIPAWTTTVAHGIDAGPPMKRWVDEKQAKMLSVYAR